jgi:regulator of CtrA degradation
MGKREEGVDALPGKLIELLERSESLYRRIARLDDVLFHSENAPVGVQSQLARLSAAFSPADGD